VPHAPHVSTTVCPAIYAIAIAAIGHVIYTAPVGRWGPVYGRDTQLAAGYFVMMPLLFPIMVVTYV